MRKKIFLLYLVLTIVAVSVTGFFTSQLTQKYYKYEVEEKLKSVALLIESQIQEEISRGTEINYNQFAKNYAQTLSRTTPSSSKPKYADVRITFINFDGNVLGESNTDFKEMENHLDRKEVLQAVQGSIGKDIRFSNTLKINFIYIALPIGTSQVVVRVSVPLIQLKNIDKAIFYYTLASILGGLLLTALLALKFSSSITRPVQEFISMAREIAMGNYSKRVNIHSNDEIGTLANTFNGMAAELEKKVADIRDKNIKLDSIINSMTSGIVAVDQDYKVILINSIACEMFDVMDSQAVMDLNIIELIRNHQINLFLKESIESNKTLVNEITIGPPEDKVLRIHTSPIKSKNPSRLNSGGIATIHDITNIRKLEQIRTEFVSNVTHELKTPLTSIRGFIETLRGGAMQDQSVAKKFLDIIDIEAERLSMLINDILQLAEIESKQKDANIDTYDLKSIIVETLAILQGVADKKGVTLVDQSNPNIAIMANRDRIKQMLINLIDNGIKYNSPNGSVTVNAYKAEGKVVVTVKDTGIGIADEHSSRIFERFYRVDKGRSRNMGGTGLGLSIVKHIVNLYSGDIKVTSQPGIGTKFTIQFPS